MSILEKFYFLFKMDTSEVKKGADDVEKSASRIDHALQKTHKEAKGFSEEFSHHLKHHNQRAIMDLLFTVVSFGAVLESFKKSFEYADQVSKASEALGVNVEQLDAWDEAVIKVNGSADKFQESLQNLAKHFHTTASVALKFLPQLASIMHGMSKASSNRLGRNLGLDEHTILLLQKGRKEVEAIIAQQKALGVVTEQDKEKIDKFNDSWRDTSQEFRRIALTSEMDLLPTLKNLLDDTGEFLGFFLRHPDVITGFMYASGISIAYLAAKFLYLKFTAKGAAGALFRTRIAALGIASAFALAYDDVKGYEKGQDSVTGEIMKKWPQVGEVIVAVFDEINRAAKDWMDKLELAINLIEKMRNISKNNKDSIENNPMNPFSHSAKQIIEHVASAKNQLNSASQSPLSLPYSGQGALRPVIHKNNVIQIGDIVINTQSNDPQEIGYGVLKTLKDHIDQVTNTYDDGIYI